MAILALGVFRFATDAIVCGLHGIASGINGRLGAIALDIQETESPPPLQQIEEKESLNSGSHIKPKRYSVLSRNVNKKRLVSRLYFEWVWKFGACAL